MNTKSCSICREVKGLDEFYLSSYRHKDGTQAPLSRCKVCTYGMTKDWLKKNEPILKEKRKEWHRNRVKNDPEHNANRKLRNWEIRLDLPRGWYWQQFERQSGKCAICGKEENSGHTKIHSKTKKRLAIDHCHDKNIARGLLCMSCNTKLAVLEDSDFVAKAQAYLSQYP